MEMLTILITLLSVSLLQVIDCANFIQKSEGIGLKSIENLDDDGKVILGWEVDLTEGIITFEIEAETKGYIGFGISPQGSMTGADIIIGGVLDDGTPYFSDRFGTGFEEPKIDEHADWTLTTAAETMNTTYLKFSRPLNSCDEEDYPITNDTTRIIWALGTTDDIQYHTASGRGSRSLNLLGAPIPEIDLGSMMKWEVMLNMTMPEDVTAYWCSFHKGPLLTTRHHILAFEALLESELALRHTHHFTLYNCYLPKDSNETLDQVFGNITVDKGVMGDFCFKPQDQVVYPTSYCTEFVYVWAKGGKRFVLPEGLGYPIGPEDAEGKEQYYMFEIHYDNPEATPDATFNTGISIYYTDKLREIEATQLFIGHDSTVAVLVPPNTAQYVVAGHCSPDCTAKFPEEGITVFNSMLHSHLSGRKLKIRHFRNGQELPWLDFDDHYDFNYQQNKPLTREVKILPGDQLTYECTYDSTWKDGKVVMGGLSTRDEMCEAFLWYYPKMEIDSCGSTYDMDRSFTDLDITNITSVTSVGNYAFYITEPEYLKGEFEDSMSYKYNWTEEARERHQYMRRYGVHNAFCYSRANYEPWTEKISYPHDFVEYVPEDVCALPN